MEQEQKLTADQIIKFLEERNFKELKEELENLHPVDLVDAMEELDKKQRMLVFRLLSKEEAEEVFTDMTSDMREELLEAMQLFITDKFSKQLESAVQKNNNVVEILKDMGIAYVSFFVDNPAYFQFLYSQSNIKIDLSLSIPDDQNYKPYIIYKNIVSKLLEQSHYPEEKQNDIIITIWAFIHGVTSLATMNNVNYDNDWREKVIDFMDVFQLPFIDNTGEKI